jgi:hypothetical protein
VKPLRLAFASLALVALVLVCPRAMAEVLVRSCDTAGAGCAKAAWVLPVNAKAVQVNRTGAPFVALADVLPTERLAACYDDPGVTAGSSTVCASRVPGRADLWQLKSVLFPSVSPKTLQLTVDASVPRWDSGAPVPSNLLTDLTVRLYGGPLGQLKTLLDSVRWVEKPAFRREGTTTLPWCFAGSLGLDTTGDGTIDQESAQTPEWCGTFAETPPVLRLAPPNSITGQAPAP